MVEKNAAYRERRADDTARWREWRRRGRSVHSVEIDAGTFDLMERFGGLSPDKADDRQAVDVALGRLLRRAWKRFCAKLGFGTEIFRDRSRRDGFRRRTIAAW
jgi:hypothetical protein